VNEDLLEVIIRHEYKLNPLKQDDQIKFNKYVYQIIKEFKKNKVSILVMLKI